MLSKTKEAKAVKEFRKALKQYTNPKGVTITCKGCKFNDKCEWAWDLYNTNGDCLAMK